MKNGEVPTVPELLAEAVRQAGTQTELAKLCGVSQQTISLALCTGRCTPALAAAIHKATRGKVKKAELCPEVFAA